MEGNKRERGIGSHTIICADRGKKRHRPRHAWVRRKKKGRDRMHRIQKRRTRVTGIAEPRVNGGRKKNTDAEMEESGLED